MKEQQPPERFAPHKLAINRGTIRGVWPLTAFERLTPLLAQTDGSVRCSIEGEIDAARRQLLHISVQAELQVSCQTCFGPMTVPVDTQFTLHVVKHEDDVDEESDIDPLIVPEDDYSTLEVIEDELILSLPVVANHEPSACKISAAQLRDDDETLPEVSTSENPFAELVRLKKTTDH